MTDDGFAVGPGAGDPTMVRDTQIATDIIEAAVAVALRGLSPAPVLNALMTVYFDLAMHTVGEDGIRRFVGAFLGDLAQTAALWEMQRLGAGGRQ